MTGNKFSPIAVSVSLLVGLALTLGGWFPPIHSAHADPGVLYAAPNGATSGTCNSWANACTLQYALSQAVSGDEIWVERGVHYPGTIRADTFTLKNGVALYGGFAGTETKRDQRNWQTNKTILSGDVDGNDTNTDGNHIAETWKDIQGDNTYHVVTGNWTDSTAILDGFVITAGQANGGLFPDNYGGGMDNESSSPTLRNITFSGNSAAFNGGGMYNDSSSPTLTNVTFSGNSAHYYGGGMFNYSGDPTLANVTFSDNSANTEGGGMYNYHSNPTLSNVTFSGNSTSEGGGMYNDSSSPTLANVTFSDNSASEGGGMSNYYSNPTLSNVTFSGNSTSGSGGGMYNWWSSSPRLTNVTFSGNSASEGGGMYNDSSSPTLANVTFSDNSASEGGGMYNWWSSSPRLANVILWGDKSPTGPEIYNNSSTPAISYSDIQGCGGSGSWNSACGTDGGGNIDADPRFVNAAGGNLRLQPASPCIDAGNNAAVPAGVTTDLDGNPRFVDIPTVPDTGSGMPPIVDMGAYEAQLKQVNYVIFLPLVRRNVP